MDQLPRSGRRRHRRGPGQRHRQQRLGRHPCHRFRRAEPDPRQPDFQQRLRRRRRQRRWNGHRSQPQQQPRRPEPERRGRRGRRREFLRQRLSELPADYVGRSGGGRHARHRHAQQPRIDHVRPRFLRESFVPGAAESPAAGRDVHRLDRGDDRRFGQRPVQRAASDRHRGRRSRDRDRDQPRGEHLGALAGDRLPRDSRPRRAGRQQPSVGSRGAVRAGRHDDDRRQPGPRHVRQRVRARLRRARPLAGRRLQHRGDESERPLGHAAQRLRLPVFGHRAFKPLR